MAELARGLSPSVEKETVSLEREEQGLKTASLQTETHGQTYQEKDRERERDCDI